MLYMMTAAKIILPLVLLPYLTRVLTKDAYGLVSYVKAVMQYMQLFVDFGFMLSATKEVALVREDKEKLSFINGDTTLARCILAVFAFAVLLVMSFKMPLLNNNLLFTLLSFIPVALSCFFMDFLFRGLEEMHVLTIRFIVTRGLSTFLTFFVVSSEKDLLWIPILEIIGSLAAIILVLFEINKRGLNLRITKIGKVVGKIKDSAVYFFSDMAATTFNALNTILVGIYMTASQVADWSLCLQIAMGIQALYSPITGSLYPYMIKTKDLNIIKKILVMVMSVILIGTIVMYYLAPWGLTIIGGKKYVSAVPLLRAFIPLLILSFPAMLFGWPCLGAINKQAETSLTTVITSIVQVLCLCILLINDRFTLLNLAYLRGATESLMLIMRFGFCVKYRECFYKNE